jgi:oxygen-dependent protoporphyrinogen oxidase
MRKRSRAQGAAAAAGPRYGLFASLRGGLQTLVDRLVERLAGCELRLNSPVSAVVRLEKCFTLALLEDYVEADLVVIATPAHAAAPLCRTLDQILAFTLVTIPYAGVATVNLAFRREQLARLPAGAGFVVPEVESRAIVACSIASQKYDGRAPDHGVLLRAFVGGAQHEDRLEQDDETLVAGVLGDLRDLVGLEGEPRFARVHRHPKAMAQYHLGHREQVQVIRSYERQFPGLALVGNGYEGVGIPDIIAQADAAAARLMAEEKGRGARGEGREETSR